MNGQEYDKNAREDREAGPRHAATQLAHFGLLGPVLLGFCISLTSSQFTHIAGPETLILASAPQLLGAKGDQACWCEGFHGTMQWGWG